MGIRKSTRVEPGRLIHVWTDDRGFRAEVFKMEWTWSASAGDKSMLFSKYQSAVDWVMDEWRLSKTGRGSWEELAAEMAGDLGLDWEALSDDEQRDLVDAARSTTRTVNL